MHFLSKYLPRNLKMRTIQTFTVTPQYIKEQKNKISLGSTYTLFI